MSQSQGTARDAAVDIRALVHAQASAWVAGDAEAIAGAFSDPCEFIGVGPNDPVTFIGVPLVLLALGAVFAGFLGVSITSGAASGLFGQQEISPGLFGPLLTEGPSGHHDNDEGQEGDANRPPAYPDLIPGRACE